MRTAFALAALLAVMASISGCAPNLSSWSPRREAPEAAPISCPDVWPSRIRDANGKLIRNRQALVCFARMTGHTYPRPGYRADHWIPLFCGGVDTPGNLQWLTIEEHAAKSKWERSPCSAWWDGTNLRLLQGAR